VRASVVSTGITRFGRRPETLEALLSEAGREALERAPSGARPQAILVGNMASGSLAGIENLAARVSDALGLTRCPVLRVEAASASGAAAFQEGCRWVEQGTFDRVLVLAGEKMTGRSTPEVTRILASSLSDAEKTLGGTMPSLAALLSQLYLDRYHVPPEAIGAVTVRNRAQGCANPHAQFQTPVTLDEVNSSRWVSTPLRLLHCAAISDGAAAVVLGPRGTGVPVLGYGQATDVLDVAQREPGIGFQATRDAARFAYKAARTSPEDLDLAEVHDAFAPFQWMDLEDLGLCPPGEAPSWIERGGGLPESSLVVNPSGGILSRGHPVGASGLAQIVEAIRRLDPQEGADDAGRRRRAVCQSVGGMGSHNFVTVLGREGP
jgi:acetyl-CoA C-acetyltransferase